MSYKFERSVDVNFDGADKDSRVLDLRALALTDQKYKFRPTGILISGSNAELAIIRGILWGNANNVSEYTLTCNEPHSLAFWKIYRDGTTTKTFQVLGA